MVTWTRRVSRLERSPLLIGCVVVFVYVFEKGHPGALSKLPQISHVILSKHPPPHIGAAFDAGSAWNLVPEGHTPGSG